MPSKWDQIRAGQAVEIEPGLSGRINKEKKTLELSNGRILDVSNNSNFFPSSERELSRSKQKEYLEKGAKGSSGEFIHQYTSQGIPGGLGDIVSYLTQSGEDYADRKHAEQQVSERISRESPYISGAATGANIATDIALTRGMSALKAAPLLTLGSAGSRIFTEPEDVAMETAGSALLGKGLDFTGNYLSRVATRRGASRALPAEQEAVRNSNILGQQNVTNLNNQQMQEFNALKQNVKSVNESRLLKHQEDLLARKNSMVEAKNNFENAKSARDSQILQMKNEYEIAKMNRSSNQAALESEYRAAKTAAEQETKRLNDEFKLAKNQYEESLRKLPELQKQAQEEYSANVIKNSKEIERSFPRSSKISTEELGLNEFLADTIGNTGLAGSKEANQVKRFLSAIFPEGEIIGGRELSKKYRALEEAIQRGSPEVQSLLNQFKNHLGKRLPVIVEDAVTFSKVMPHLKKGLASDIQQIMKELNLGKDAGSVSIFADTNMRTILRNEIVPSNFVQKLQSGDLARDIAQNIMTPEGFLVDISDKAIKEAQKNGILQYIMKDAETKHKYFVDQLTKRLEARLAKYEIKAVQSANTASQKLGKDLKGTYGMAEPVPQPMAPQPPNSVPIPAPPTDLPSVAPINLPSPIAPPSTPSFPSKPSLLPQPNAPVPQTFIPQPEPTLPAASGMGERLGDLLEKNPLGGKGLIDNPLTKLAGLKYLLGSAALPAEAAYLGTQALTSPTALGEAARLTFKQAGIQAIESWARKYPSYNNGILENPQDRRSLTKEIEDDFSIPIEQKAVLQSKVNRGRPIQERL